MLEQKKAIYYGDTKEDYNARKELIFIMMAIQMRNPASIKLSLKVKIVIISIVVLIFCIIGIILYLNYATDKYSAKIYDNPKSVEEIFAADQETFTEVLYLLKDSELFDYLYSIDKKSIYNTSIPQSEKYFSEKEYEYLCFFLNKYRPYEIGKSNGDLYFVFLCESDDVTLYYTEREDESLSDFLNVISQYSKVKIIKDKWYVREQSSDMIRQ